MKNFANALPKVVIGGFILCLIAFISFSCIDMPLAPIAPTSEIKLEGISIIDITKTFADFLAKDTTLTRNSDGTSSYIKSKSLAPQSIPTIKFMPEDTSLQVNVGRFKVNGFSAPQNYKASDLGFPASGSAPVPSGIISLTPISVNDTSEFDYASIGSGRLSLIVTNNMPVPIDFPNPIVLHNNWTDPVDNSEIASFTIPGQIDPAGIDTVTVPIDGKFVRGLLTTDPIQLHTSGSPTSVTFSSSSGISISLISTPSWVDSATAVIPYQYLTSKDSSVFVVDSLTVVQSAAFTKGTLLIRSVNNLNIDVGVDFIANEIKQTNASFSNHQMMTAKETRDYSLDFSKISLQTDPPIRQRGTQIKYRVGITILDSKGVKKLVTKNDFVQASLIPQDSLVVKSIVGKIEPTIVQIDTGVSSGINGVDLGNLSAQVVLKGMQLSLKLLITGGFPTDYHLAFVAKNSRKNLIDSIKLISGSSSDFPRIIPTVGSTSGSTTIHLSGTDFDNFISKFFPDVPDSFFVRGYLTIDPPDVFAQMTTYRIDDTTKVYPSFDINFPMALGIQKGVMKQVVAFGDQEKQKDFTKSVNQGMLTFYFYNKMPFKMFLHANFLGNYNSQTHKGDTLLFIALSDTIQAATVDNNGFTTAQTFSKATVSLNSAQMVQFNNADSLYIRLDMSTSNNGQIVRVRNTDYIRVYAKGDITYTVNKQ